jgi:oligoribonuclease NrnB/cAMP/cGMP phosphodiesterase (DHH superfamily)
MRNFKELNVKKQVTKEKNEKKQSSDIVKSLKSKAKKLEKFNSALVKPRNFTRNSLAYYQDNLSIL